MPTHPTDALIERLRAAIAADLDRFLDQLEHLVGIDSGTYGKAGVDRLGDWMAAQLADLGAVVERHRHAVYGDTIVGAFDGPPGRPSVLAIGHMDTVFEAGTAALRPFRRDDGRAYGPGVGDMKSGLLVGLHALAALRAVAVPGVPWLPVSRLWFVANPDEEIGSPSSAPIIRALSEHADAALVLEGARPGGEIVSARKGMIHARITIVGRSAHAGVDPDRGRSAILEAAHKTVALHGLNGRWEGVTVNVGHVRGGTRPNIVADEALLGVDVRAATLATQEAVLAAIETIVRTSTVPDVTAGLELTTRSAPFERSAASAALVAMTADVAARIGFELRDTSTGGGSDGNTTAALGVPTLDGLGPVTGGAHSPEEYVELDSIVPRTLLLAALLAALGDADAHPWTVAPSSVQAAERLERTGSSAPAATSAGTSCRRCRRR